MFEKTGDKTKEALIRRYVRKIGISHLARHYGSEIMKMVEDAMLRMRLRDNTSIVNQWQRGINGTRSPYSY